jgi:osmotically-inducible protein OsmY
VSSRITEWRLSATDLQSDLDRGVTIVRTKDTAVGAPTGVSDDEVIKTMVKGKFQADSETEKAMIEVDAKNGEVTLKGSANSAATLGRAMALALDTVGVTKVSSDVKIQAKDE